MPSFQRKEVKNIDLFYLICCSLALRYWLINIFLCDVLYEDSLSEIYSKEEKSVEIIYLRMNPVVFN